MKIERISFDKIKENVTFFAKSEWLENGVGKRKTETLIKELNDCNTLENLADFLVSNEIGINDPYYYILTCML